MECTSLARVGPGGRRGLACLLAMMAAVLPAMAQAHPDVSAHLGYEDVTFEASGPSGILTLNRRLNMGSAQVTQTAGAFQFGIAGQYGTVIDLDPNDYFGHEADHLSLRIDRQIFLGATASLRIHKDWRLFATAGRVQVLIHDGMGDMTRRTALNEGTLMGWRMTAGVQRPMALGLMTLGWQMTHYTGEQGSDPVQPTRGSGGHVAVDLTIPW